MFSKAAVVLVLVGVALAAPADFYNAPNHYEDDKPYSFRYGIDSEHTGTNFGQAEESNGDTVKGYYTVQLPDGRRQTVNYVVDDINGYQAVVSYEGQAQHPQHYNPPVTYRPQTAYQPAYYH